MTDDSVYSSNQAYYDQLMSTQQNELQVNCCYEIKFFLMFMEIMCPVEVDATSFDLNRTTAVSSLYNDFSDSATFLLHKVTSKQEKHLFVIKAELGRFNNFQEQASVS